MDHRIGNKFLNSGPGFGGSCFKKDILNLIYICDHYGLKETSSYWQKVIEINDWQQKRIINIIIEKLFGTINGKNIAILGFAFKANTNDTRESPAIKICEELIIEGAKLKIYDPKVNSTDIENCLHQLDSSPKSVIKPSFEVSESISSAILDCDGIIILTEWPQFSEIEWGNYISFVRLLLDL